MGDFIVKKSIILAILCLFVANTVVAQTHDRSDNELLDLVYFMIAEDASILEWETTWKESISQARTDDLVETLSRKYHQHVTKDEQKIKYSFEDSHIYKGFNVLFHVIVPRQKHADAELVVVIKGDGWYSDMEKNYFNTVLNLQKEYFTSSVKKFACLTTKGNGIISSDYFLNKLTNYFQIQQKQTQFDTVEQSTHKKIIYGYTPVWERKISVNDTPMNIQIAVEENGSDNPTYVIGTPILINEY